MRTTIEIADSLYPKIEAASAAAGLSVPLFLAKLVEREAANGAESSHAHDAVRHWWDSFSGVQPDAADEVQQIVDEEFSKIDPKDWE